MIRQSESQLTFIRPYTYTHYLLGLGAVGIYMKKGRCLIRISLNLWRTSTSGAMTLVDGSQASMMVKLGVSHGAIFV